VKKAKAKKEAWSVEPTLIFLHAKCPLCGCSLTLENEASKKKKSKGGGR
jgi:hypothetical protein